jgi:hypothetical protein
LPINKRFLRPLLWVAAAALLVAGAAGPIQRAIDERTRAAELRARFEQLKQERASLETEFAGRRDEIVAQLREHLQSGRYADAMTGAARYVALGDPEVRDIHRKAAREVSLQQAIARYRALAQSQCTEEVAKDRLAHLLDAERVDGKPRPPIEYAGMALARVRGDEASKAVLARLQAPHPKEGALAADADWITRVRAHNIVQPMPDYLSALATKSAQDLLCVWRVDATRQERARPVRFTMLLWLAPSRDGNTLVAEPIVYDERS